MHYDNYTGFEGEPELTFVTQDGVESISIWDGYFMFIMDEACPNQDGIWDSLALLYHMHIGWYLESPFELKDTDKVLEELESLFSENWDPVVYSVYNNLLKVFRYAAKMNLSINVYYS